jgi:Xaa-Pro aminopeptidase
MAERGVDALLLSVGSDLPWLTGYRAMPLERLTMLVFPANGEPTLVVPALEAPRVDPHAGAVSFAIRPWTETEDPVAIAASLVRETAGQSLAIDDRCWATFVLGLQSELPDANWNNATSITAELRMAKDATEMQRLRDASAANDTVAIALQNGEIPLIGRTEAEVSVEIAARIVAAGHEVHNFSIVGAGPNGASPHHDASNRVIGRDELIVFDFGGTMHGYCSDMTRMVFTGETVPPDIADAYAVLKASQQAGVDAGVVGFECQQVDRAARQIINDAGYGEYFIHRTGHGIGLDAHEDPYMVEGNDRPIAAGYAFSVEPGIYLPGKWGMRLEDLVIAHEAGPENLNSAPRDIACVPV